MLRWNINTIKDKELLTLFIGRKGGITTARIMDKLLTKPYNKNQLATQLDVDYNTITHHITIMGKHNYITPIEFDNCTYYHPSEKLFKSLEEYKIIRDYLLSQDPNVLD